MKTIIAISILITLAIGSLFALDKQLEAQEALQERLAVLRCLDNPALLGCDDPNYK